MSDAASPHETTTEDRPQVRRNPSFLEQTVTFQDPRDEILRNIKLIIRIRWVLAPSIFLLLIASVLLGFSSVDSFSPDQITVNGINFGGMLLLNLVYLIAVRRIENPKPLVLFQIFIDVFYFALTVYKTGGIVSPFVFLYFTVIFSGSILISGKTAFLIAGIVSCIHVTVGLLELYGVIPHQAFFSPFKDLARNSAYQILSGGFSIFSFFAFASLASFLSGKLVARRRWLENANTFMKRQNTTLMFLYRTSQAITHCDTEHDLVDFILRELAIHLDLNYAYIYMVKKKRGFRGEKRLELAMVRGIHDEDDDRIETLNPLDDDSSSYGEAGNMSVAAGVPDGVPAIVPMKEGAGLAARCALYQEAFNASDPKQLDAIKDEINGPGATSPFALAPMVLRGETIGVIGIGRSEQQGSIGKKDFEILKMFSAQAAIAIKGMRA